MIFYYSNYSEWATGLYEYYTIARSAIPCTALQYTSHIQKMNISFGGRVKISDSGNKILRNFQLSSRENSQIVKGTKGRILARFAVYIESLKPQTRV